MTKVFKDKQGFTLIELLVVIAIIGILSSIVLISLKGAKDRANDGRIISDMSQLRTQAEIIHDINGSYASTTCSAYGDPCTCQDDDIETLCTDINKSGGSLTIHYDSANDKYCAEVQLNTGKWYCVDHELRAVRDKRCDTNANVYTCTNNP